MGRSRRHSPSWPMRLRPLRRTSARGRRQSGQQQQRRTLPAGSSGRESSGCSGRRQRRRLLRCRWVAVRKVTQADVDGRLGHRPVHRKAHHKQLLARAHECACARTAQCQPLLQLLHRWPSSARRSQGWSVSGTSCWPRRSSESGRLERRPLWWPLPAGGAATAACQQSAAPPSRQLPRGRCPHPRPGLAAPAAAARRRCPRRCPACGSEIRWRLQTCCI